MARKPAPRKSPGRRPPAESVEVPRSLREVVSVGDRRASLMALRDELARRLESAEREVAPMARQLLVVLRELDDLPVPAEESKVDELTRRRKDRIARTQAG